jgi:hypothetical protein
MRSGMDTTTRELEALEADYRAKVAAVRRDSSLSWEKQELKVKALGEEYHARRRELEEEAA